MSYRNAAATSRRFGFLTTVSTVAVFAASFAAQAQTTSAQQAQADTIDEITVTGTRVVRDGYEAPTPVTVIGVEQMEQQPMQHISDFVARLPAFSGAQTTTSGGNEISTGRQSQNNLNLRGLDVFRTLVLLDGNRIVSGDVNGAVNVSDLPTPLINRVDVVTGGASAAYGSDAVAGVVNFVLDRDFSGLKGEVQGGITNEGDDPSYKISLTYGTPFAGGRGHILLSGEHAWNKGIFGARASRGDFWGYDTAHIILNPAYSAANPAAAPQYLLATQAATLLSAPGGLITAGPLKGITFNKDGSPFMYRYGSLTNAQFNVGGDWDYSDVTYHHQTLSNKVSRQAYFGRISYDLTDNTTVFFNLLHSDSYGMARSKLDDQLGNMVIRADNPFLDPSVQAQMTALGLSQFNMGSFNLDLPYITTHNDRLLWSYAAGLEGKVDAFDTTWNWSVYAQYGLARSDLSGRVLNRPRFTRALDSVRDTNGAIVCRVNVDANLANDDPACVPWNPFGWGNNGDAAVNYSKGTAHLIQRNTQHVFTAGVSGEPFESWAGPVSVATGFEWRRQAVSPIGGTPDADSLASNWTAGNYKGTDGKYTVAEGYIETVVPLARDTAWAQLLDFNGAVRFTGYSTSGYVTTWKAGLTYAPVDEVRIRATRSRDIRAGHLGELYDNGGGGQSPGLIDPFRPNDPPVSFLNSVRGNPDLLPEKADTTSAGVVYQPSWLEGFSASVDFYNINIKGAVATVGGQTLVDRCFAGETVLCPAIIRNAPAPGETLGTIRIVQSQPFNLAALSQQGWDIEASYSTTLDRFVDSWQGDVTLRAIGTHVAHSRRDDGRTVVDYAGTNSGQGPLDWRWMFNANYTIDALSITWTGRYMSSGRYGGETIQYVQCNAGSCPVSTPTFPTIDINHIDSRFYHDLALTYRFLETADGGSVQGFLNISNLFNKEPPLVGSTNYWYMSVNPQLYDTIGRRFYAGVRFSL